jgi:hypothetical protein
MKKSTKSIGMFVLTFFIVYGFLNYQFDMFIPPEVMAYRALKDYDKVPKEYQYLVKKIIYDINEIEKNINFNTGRYTINFTGINKEHVAKTLNVDAAVITTITIHLDHHDGYFTTYTGYTFMTLKKLNFLYQWEILEVKYLPIVESRRGFKYPEDFID